jgi:hypothetical protein
VIGGLAGRAAEALGEQQHLLHHALLDDRIIAIEPEAHALGEQHAVRDHARGDLGGLRGLERPRTMASRLRGLDDRELGLRDLDSPVVGRARRE